MVYWSVEENLQVPLRRVMDPPATHVGAWVRSLGRGQGLCLGSAYMWLANNYLEKDFKESQSICGTEVKHRPAGEPKAVRRDQTAVRSIQAPRPDQGQQPAAAHSGSAVNLSAKGDCWSVKENYWRGDASHADNKTHT